MMRFSIERLSVVVVAGIVAFCDVALGDVSIWTVGNEQHPWSAWGQLRNMEELADVHAIQPRAFPPDENAVQMVGRWYGRKFPIEPEYREGDPRVWEGTAEEVGSMVLVDGDGTTARIFTRRDGTLGRFWTLDFGVPIPAYKVVFYPRQEGLDIEGRPTVDNYIRGYKLSGGLGGDFPSHSAEVYYYGDRRWHEHLYHFEHMLAHEYGNTQSMVTVTFPPQFMRFFRLQNITDRAFEIAEVEVYADGCAAVAEYTSKIIDLDQAMNFGKIGWALSTWRKVGGAWVSAPDAPVSIVVETRSGKDDTPLIYHEVLRTGGEKVISEEEYYSGALQPMARTNESPKPGQQGSITDDLGNWSAWSLPYAVSGEEIASPGARRYVQFRLVLRTDATDEVGRLDSLFFELSPSLADRVLGEVSVLDDPTPSEHVAHVAAGERTTFAYDVKAVVSSGQSGFDGVEIATPSQATLRDVLMGDPLVSLPPDEYEVDVRDPHRLMVAFPSHRIVDDTPLRLVFDTSVLVLGTRLSGQVLDTQSEDFPQPIEPGNAHDGVSTDQLMVLIKEGLVGAILDSVWAHPRAITPNGDGMNDQTEICYHILRLTDAADVEISMCDLSGIPVRKLFRRRRRSGMYAAGEGAIWDGHDDAGERVSPGVYFYYLSVETDEGSLSRAGAIMVVY